MIDFLAAFLTALLSGIGVGGGGLLVLYLTLFLGEPQLRAQGINIAFFLVSAAAAFPIHASRRRLNFPLILLIGGLGALGVLAGSTIAAHIDSTILQKIFGAFLLFGGIHTLFGHRKE